MRKKSLVQTWWFLCIVPTQSSQLPPRKSSFHDPYITCDYGAPVTHNEGLPDIFDQRDYSSLIALCSAAHGARANVGCFCSTAAGEVHCDQNLADPTLWAARYALVSPSEPWYADMLAWYEEMGIPNGEISYAQLCMDACKCTNTEPRAQDRLSGLENKTKIESSGPTHRKNDFAAGSLIGNGQPAEHPRWQNQCGNNCTSAGDCKAPAEGNGTCTCQAYSTQYQPGSGTMAFIAACLITLESNGKRAEGLPCACNGTYVSYSCCDVPDGSVWEPPEKKLGNVFIRD